MPAPTRQRHEPPEQRVGELDVGVTGQILALRVHGRRRRSLAEVGKSWEWASLAWTTSRVDALKRGLQVVSVRRSAKTFLMTSVSLGDTTTLLVAS